MPGRVTHANGRIHIFSKFRTGFLMGRFLSIAMHRTSPIDICAQDRSTVWPADMGQSKEATRSGVDVAVHSCVSAFCVVWCDGYCQLQSTEIRSRVWA